MQLTFFKVPYIHQFDPSTCMENSLRFLNDIVRQGKVLYLGVSNWAAWQIMKSLHISRLNLLTSIDCIQPMYNLIKRQAEVEIMPLAEDQQLAVMPYGPVGGGVLTGKYAGLSPDKPARLHDKDFYSKRYMKTSYFETAQKFSQLADELEVDAAPLAISWVMHHSAITAPIIGARNTDQLRSSLTAVDIKMTDDLYKQITDLSQAPSPANDRLEESIDSKFQLR